MADHASKIKDIIEKELGVEREKLVPEASFIEDLGADSLDIVELVMEFEKEFGIDIPDEDAEKLRTVGDAVASRAGRPSGARGSRTAAGRADRDRASPRRAQPGPPYRIAQPGRRRAHRFGAGRDPRRRPGDRCEIPAADGRL